MGQRERIPRRSTLVRAYKTGVCGSCGMIFEHTDYPSHTRRIRYCSKSCSAKARSTKHGLTYTPEHNSWTEMRRRCRTTTRTCTKRYTRLGVVVCEGWNDFSTFLQDMGTRPPDKHSVDRIDNDGNYSCGHCPQCLVNGWPMNCRWATVTQQGRNRHDNILFTYEGVTKTASEWAEITGLKAATIKGRRKLGWSDERALTTPV
jgi:hypothetical protein